MVYDYFLNDASIFSNQCHPSSVLGLHTTLIVQTVNYLTWKSSTVCKLISSSSNAVVHRPVTTSNSTTQQVTAAGGILVSCMMDWR